MPRGGRGSVAIRAQRDCRERGLGRSRSLSHGHCTPAAGLCAVFWPHARIQRQTTPVPGTSVGSSVASRPDHGASHLNPPTLHFPGCPPGRVSSNNSQTRTRAPQVMSLQDNIHRLSKCRASPSICRSKGKSRGVGQSCGQDRHELRPRRATSPLSDLSVRRCCEGCAEPEG